jgi:hypothetical protein
VAKLSLAGDRITACAWETVGTVSDAMEWFGPNLPLAFGVDVLTAWSTGPNGDRPADRALRLAYPEAAGSVLSPNGLRGAMCVNGMAIVCRFRGSCSSLLVSETHPKVLYFSLTRALYRNTLLSERTAVLAQWIGLPVGKLAIGNDNEWDAAASAYAVWEGLRGRWTEDLHQKPTLTGECLIHPAGPTVYFWPESLDIPLP